MLFFLPIKHNMTMQFGSDEASEPTALKVIGAALIGTAFLFAGWSGAMQGGSYQAGQRIGQLLAIFLILLLVSWLFTRNSAPATRAYGRIVVGVLLWLVGGVNFNADSTEKKIGQAFLRDAIAMNAVHTKKFQALNERVSSADLASVLTPANVTTQAGIAKGREQVAQIKTLIAARDALIRKNFDDIRTLVGNLPAGPTKSGAEPMVAKRRTETLHAFDNLSKTQLAHLDVVGQILNWCAAQDGKLRNQDGQLRYTSREQFTEMQAWLDKLTVAEAAANKAFETANQLERTAEARSEKSLKRANELLK